jgi:hypothetical protein
VKPLNRAFHTQTKIHYYMVKILAQRTRLCFAPERGCFS